MPTCWHLKILKRLKFFKNLRKISKIGGNFMNLSEKLKIILKYRRWTQTRLAKYLGISPPRINNWLHNKNKPNAEWLTDRIDKLFNECNIRSENE